MIPQDKREQIFDNVARFAGSTAGALSGLSRQIKDEVRARVDDMATKMDLVPREDFDDLQARFDVLEKRLAALEKTAKPAEKTKKPATKKAAPKK